MFSLGFPLWWEMLVSVPNAETRLHPGVSSLSDGPEARGCRGLSSRMLLRWCLAVSELMNCFQNWDSERINYAQLGKNIIKNIPYIFLITESFYSLETLCYCKAIVSLK